MFHKARNQFSNTMNRAVAAIDSNSHDSIGGTMIVR